MGIWDRNLYLQIIHKNGANRKQVDWIMKDIDKDDVFNENEEDDIFDEIDALADIEFDETKTKEQKEREKKLLTKRKEESLRKGKLEVTEEMIRKKQQEYIKKGLLCEEDIDTVEEYNEKKVIGNRYGRSPFHEAIAFRNIELVKKYIKERKYLNSVDNNGNTPREMAYYEWKEILYLFPEL